MKMGFGGGRRIFHSLQVQSECFLSSNRLQMFICKNHSWLTDYPKTSTRPDPPAGLGPIVEYEQKSTSLCPERNSLTLRRKTEEQ